MVKRQIFPYVEYGNSAGMGRDEYGGVTGMCAGIRE